MVMLLVKDRALENRADLQTRRLTGQRLRQARQTARLTLEAAGDAIGVVRQSVSKWESGGNYPTPDRLQKLAALYGVSVDWLLNGDRRVAEDRAAYDVSGSRATVAGEIKQTLESAEQDLPVEELRRIRDHVQFMVQQARKERQDEGDEP